MKMQSFIFVVLLFFLDHHGVLGKSKPISAGLSSKWKSTPIIIEASEYLAEEGNDLFWKYVDTIISFDVSQTSSSPHMLYEAAIKAARMSIGPDDLKINLLKFSIALRMYSPRIEMFHQLANRVAPSGCDTFFDVHGTTTCNYKEVHQLLKEAQASNLKPSSTFQPDHIFPISSSSSETIILHGDISSHNFKEAHDFAKRMATEGNCRYVLRHFVRARPDGKVRLSGYGIELAMKSTEYKARDDSEVKGDADASSTAADQDDLEIDGFDFAALRQLHPNLSSQLTNFRNHLIDSTNEMQPMKVWQLQDLSYQAAARVLSSPPEEQLRVLQDISQNFPLRVRSLVKQQVSDELREEIKKNQQDFGNLELETGDSIFLLNGMQIDVTDTDMFELVDLLRSEGKLIGGLRKLQIKGNALQKIMKLNIQSDANENYLLDIRDPSIIWVNDIEHDSKYSKWPANLHELLRPAFPGTLRRVRKNMFHLVVVVDPLHEDAKYLVESAEIFWANDVPLRIGFSFVVDDSDNVDGENDVGVALVRAYNYVRDELDDNEKSFSFLTGIYKSLTDDQKLTVDHIKLRLSQKFKSADISSILGPKSEFDENRKLGKSFHERSGLNGPVNVLMNGALLSENDIASENFEQTVIEKILEGLPVMQRATYMGQVDNSMSVINYLMSRPGVVPRFSDRVLSSDDKFIDFLGNAHKENVYWNIKEFSKLQASDKSATIAEYMRNLYLSKSDSSKYVRPITMWVVADVETKDGRSFVYNAIKHIKSSSATRIAIIHNSRKSDDQSASRFIKPIEAALVSLTNNHAKNFITKLMKEENAANLESGEKSLSDFYVGGMDQAKFENVMTSDLKIALPHITSHSDWATSVLGLRPGQNVLVINGKVIGPLNKDESFISDDFHLAEVTIHSQATEQIQNALKGINLETPEMSDLIMKLTSHLSSQTKMDSERHDLSPSHQDHSVIKIASSNPETSYDITVVLDPASDRAQEIVPVVMVLQQVLDANVKIFMNCREKLSDMPVKRFYRFVLEPEMGFKVDNSFSDGPIAKFDDMPSKSLLTLNVHPPEGWMVEVTNSVYDLDNIKLEDVAGKFVSAEYELEYLVLEGHTKDQTSGSPPRGLQFTLGQTTDSVAMDTIVMANLGYFQLKANPGVWYLNLREGRSHDIYQIMSHENTEASKDDVIVLMDSFKSKVILVKVAKKPDKVGLSLLEETEENDKAEEEGGGIWNTITSTLSGSDNAVAPSNGNTSDVINIFSLASGHLYERLMRIMMLSVMSNTKTKVKFWLLKNYLSPQFKDFIPHLAEEHGFEYELVQYKWPRWLRQQVEKQRTMWGYKILFLDVLFPLGIDKIIFVDADQIVRADLKELRDLDLEGNPYGYTPFCDDRKEMDGFRFWKGGYWASHLAGRKYHISAIYVVDLKKFRKIAAGDRLRGQYQGLSQDPNSLANLDQDLPNNMIHQVGIKSLPQEWLWCATWCSEESKARAKTIDLCNNPLTKEPKLEAAVRIAPEWTRYDEEIKQLQAKVSAENKTEDKKVPPVITSTTEEKHSHEEL